MFVHEADMFALYVHLVGGMLNSWLLIVRSRHAGRDAKSIHIISISVAAASAPGGCKVFFLLLREQRGRIEQLQRYG
jgi:hypothetical protein